MTDLVEKQQYSTIMAKFTCNFQFRWRRSNNFRNGGLSIKRTAGCAATGCGHSGAAAEGSESCGEYSEPGPATG